MVKNVVVIHGWGANTGKLKDLSVSLSKQGWHVFIPKIPGFDAPLGKIMSLRDYSSYVAVESGKYFKGSNYFVFGHSFGGRIAVGMELYYPRRISGLVLCACGGISRPFWFKRFLFLSLAKFGLILKLFPKLGIVFKKFLYKIAREHDYEKLDGFLKTSFRKIINENLKKRVNEIKIPVLLIWGKKDKMTPLKDAKYLHKKIKNSQLILYENNGHKLPYEEFESVSNDINLWYKKLI